MSRPPTYNYVFCSGYIMTGLQNMRNVGYRG